MISQVLQPNSLQKSNSLLTSFVVGAGAQWCARLEEDVSLERRRAQTAHLLSPWPRVRARRVGWPSSRFEWRERLGQLIDAMDRSVEEMVPDPPARWRRGQSMHLTMATVGEHAPVQDDIATRQQQNPVATSQLTPVQSDARRMCCLR